MPSSSVVPRVGHRKDMDEETACHSVKQRSATRFSAKKQAKRATNSRSERALPRRSAGVKKYNSYTSRQPLQDLSKGKSGLRVSLCMIVRDEEDNLAACLESAADLVEEIVIVDTGSTDSTRDIARRFGAKVFDFSWVDSFAAARNECLLHATGDWIFWLDADERIDSLNRAKLQRLFAELGKQNKAFGITCLHLRAPESLVASESKQIRVCRNDPKIRWQNRIHEDILPALRALRAGVVWTDIVLHHTGYQDPAARALKNERDLRLLLMDYADGVDAPVRLLYIGKLCLALGRAAEALRMLQLGLNGTSPADRTARAFYRLIVECHRALGQTRKARAACDAGRAHHPLDAGLRWQEAQLREESGDTAGAERCYLQLLQDLKSDELSGTPAGMVDFLARHQLASLHAKQGRSAETF